jgi:hypothetical protein
METRWSASVNDYADQRYYASTFGRFMSYMTRTKQTTADLATRSIQEAGIGIIIFRSQLTGPRTFCTTT